MLGITVAQAKIIVLKKPKFNLLSKSRPDSSSMCGNLEPSVNLRSSSDASIKNNAITPIIEK